MYIHPYADTPLSYSPCKHACIPRTTQRPPETGGSQTNNVCICSIIDSILYVSVVLRCMCIFYVLCGFVYYIISGTPIIVITHPPLPAQYGASLGNSLDLAVVDSRYWGVKWIHPAWSVLFFLPVTTINNIMLLFSENLTFPNGDYAVRTRHCPPISVQIRVSI